MAAVIALGGAALADAFRDGTTAEEGQEGRAPTAATTDDRGAPKLRLPGLAAPGRIVFTDSDGCELRVFDIRAGRFADIPRPATTCELWAPRVGTRVAYGVPDDCGCSLKRFRLRDLEDPQANFGEYKTVAPIAWSSDGSRLAWCDTPRSGFELALGRRPERLHHCPRAYAPGGLTASVNDRHQIVIGGRPLLRARARRFVWDLAWGVDGSLAVVADGRRVDRYRGGHLMGATLVPATTAAHFPTIVAGLAPDNCAALSVDAAVVRLIDLGCFRGWAPRTFKGVYADWSPDGEWIVVAEPDAVVFHRVVGGEASVRWNVAVGQLAWVGA